MLILQEFSQYMSKESKKKKLLGKLNQEGPVVQKGDNSIHSININLHPVDSAIGFINIYPLFSVLSGR